MKQTYIPKGWDLVKLKDVIQEKSEKNINEQVKEVLSITNSQGFVKQEDYFEGIVHSKNIENYKIVRKNQFAYNPSRINVGSIDILKKYEKGALSPMYVVFQTNEDKLNADYFKYYFETNEFIQNVKNSTQGSVRESLNFVTLSGFEYLLPPLKEQKKIADILLNIDNIIEKISKKIKNLERQKQGIFNYIFDKQLCSDNTNNIKYEVLPKGWQIKKLKDISTMITVGIATSATSFYRDKGIPMLRNQNIKKNRLSEQDLIFIDEDYEKRFKNKRLKENDIIVVRTGNPGIACIVPKRYENAQTFTTLIIRIDLSKNNGNYVCQYINSNIGINYFEKCKIGGGQKNISAKILENMKIILPQKEEQIKIVNILENIDKQIELLEQKNKEYQNLKKGLMQQLLTGKVRVKI